MGGVWKKGPGLGLFKSLNDVSQPFAAPTPHTCLQHAAGLPLTPNLLTYIAAPDAESFDMYHKVYLANRQPACIKCVLVTSAHMRPSSQEDCRDHTCTVCRSNWGMLPSEQSHLHCVLQQLGYVAIRVVTPALCVAATGVCCHHSRGPGRDHHRCE